jgi:4-hydroxy-3-methylbut-2-enyl diphosphate reductase IspH
VEQQQLEQQEASELLEDYGCWVVQTGEECRDDWVHKWEAVNSCSGSSTSSVLVPAVSPTLQAALTQQQQQPLVRTLVAAAGHHRAGQKGA